MNTNKVAISMPSELVATIDSLSRNRGVSRSKFITSILREKIREERYREIKDAYDLVYSDAAICQEQLETAGVFQDVDNSEGQEW